MGPLRAPVCHYFMKTVIITYKVVVVVVVVAVVLIDLVIKPLFEII